MGDFDAKVGKKQAGDHAVGEYGIGSKSARGESVEFAERNNLWIMNTFFRKRANRKWTWRSPNGKNKNEIDFTLCARPDIAQDVKVVGKIRCSDHRMVRARIHLDLKKQRQKQIRKKRIDELAVRVKIQAFTVSLQNRFEALNEITEVSVDTMNDNRTSIVKESTIEFGGSVTRRKPGKLSQETKNLVKRRQTMEASNATDNIELVEFSKLINI